MSKSLLIKIVKTLKVLTWVCIFGCAFFFYAGTRASTDEETQKYNYIMLVVIAVGWGLNFLSKRLPKIFLKEENEENEE